MSNYLKRSFLKTLCLLLFVDLGGSLYAHSPFKLDTYFDHLCEVNKEWLYHSEVSPGGFASFDSDADRIQLHLDLVINHLRNNIPVGINSLQKAKRLDLLDDLQEYADQKVFPINKYHLQRQPYFVDEEGINCAVGQMIDLSGHKALVTRISKDHNYDYIRDIKTEGLVEWAEEYGFTLAELAWIQPGYPPNTYISQVQGGTNGRVTKIECKGYNEGLIIAGEFTELDHQPCLNIGVYEENQLSCLGDGIDGVIRDLGQNRQSGAVYVFGELQNNGQVYPIAKYENGNWSYISIPGRSGASCTAVHFFGLDADFELAISYASIPGDQEIWCLVEGSWQKKAKVNGVVLDIGFGAGGVAYVGHFDTVEVFESNALIETLVVNNVLIHSSGGANWFGIGEAVSDTINAVVNIGGALIFGGNCGGSPLVNDICLSRYYNGVLQPLIQREVYSMPRMSIRTIAYRYGTKLVLGGDFHIEPVVGIIGSHMASYDLVSNNVEAMAGFDHAVNSLVYFDNELYIGGDFQTNIHETTNYLAKEGVPSSTIDPGLREPYKVYPNPFTASLQLEGVADGANYTLLCLDGRQMKEGIVTNGYIFGLEDVPRGAYVLSVETDDRIFVRKVVK